VEVNTKAFQDRGTGPQTVLEAELGRPIARSQDGVFVSYGLRHLPRGDAREAEELLEPVLVALDAYELRRYDEGMRQWVAPSATLRVVNLQPTAVPLTISTRLRAEGFGRRLRVLDETGTELARSDLSASKATSVEIGLTVEPGVTRLSIILGGDPVRLRDPRVWVSAEVTSLSVSSPRDVRVASYMEQVAAGVAVP
jgi:hypothetical protein